VDDAYSGVFDVDSTYVYAPFKKIQEMAWMNASQDEDGNVIPARCRLTLDIRLPPGTSSAAVRADLLAVTEGHAKRNPGASFKLEFEEPTEAYEAQTDSLIVRAFQRSILTSLHTKPAFTHKTGTGDMNTLSERMRIPCVTYGPGDSRLEHTDGEYVEIPDYLNSIAVLQGVFREFAGLSSSR
jgi:LysW-gamma-L-lysine carboxypeptidase